MSRINPPPFLKRVIGGFAERYHRTKSYMRMLKAGEIIRRYFVANSFDGAMTTLGILIGAHAAGGMDPRIIITVVVGTGLALFISGVSAVYIIESAERRKALEELEAAVLTDLDDTIIADAAKFVSFFAALVDGLAPLATSIICVTPFILGMRYPRLARYAFTASMGLILVVLFLLGLFLGRKPRKGGITYGLKMLIAGIITSLLSVVLRAV